MTLVSQVARTPAAYHSQSGRQCAASLVLHPGMGQLGLTLCLLILMLMVPLLTMKTALLRLSDKKEITAKDAALRGEKRAFCPKCRETVNLHIKKSPRGVTHFEHQSGARKGRPCPRHYHYKAA